MGHFYKLPNNRQITNLRLMISKHKSSKSAAFFPFIKSKHYNKNEKNKVLRYIEEFTTHKTTKLRHLLNSNKLEKEFIKRIKSIQNHELTSIIDLQHQDENLFTTFYLNPNLQTSDQADFFTSEKFKKLIEKQQQQQSADHNNSSSMSDHEEEESSLPIMNDFRKVDKTYKQIDSENN